MPEYMVRYYYKETLKNYVENITAIRYIDVGNIIVSIVGEEVELKEHVEDMLSIVLENYLNRLDDEDEINDVLTGFADTISDTLMSPELYDRLVNKIDTIISASKSFAFMYPYRIPVAFGDLVFDSIKIDGKYFTISKLKNNIVEVLELDEVLPIFLYHLPQL